MSPGTPLTSVGKCNLDLWHSREGPLLAVESYFTYLFNALTIFMLSEE